jgi:hypothetical protein
MMLFKTDPLLAFCKLIAWLIFLWLGASLLFAIVAGGWAVIGGERFEAILRQSYPQLKAGVAPSFALAMACIAIGIGLVGRFMWALLAIIRSVQEGEAFTLANARRIQLMAWLALISMPASLAISAALAFVVKRLGPNAPDAGIHVERLDVAGFSSAYILLTLLLFVLARLFAQAATMRDEIEGTV